MPFAVATLDDRASYRRGLHRASEHGPHTLRRFLDKNCDLFAPPEWGRLNKFGMEYGWGNVAYFVDHRFRHLRGEKCDPRMSNADRRDYPAIVETIITPHAFLRHVLEWQS